MRLFVAATLPAPVRELLSSAAARLADSVPGLSPVAEAAIHVTLRFLGEVTPVEAGALRPGLRAGTLKTAQFSAVLGGYGQFPLRGQPRVLYAGFRSGLEGYRSLWQEVCALTAGVGEEEPEQSFVPHVTLARNKKLAIPRGCPALAELQELLDGLRLELRVESVVLYESVLDRGGPRYTALEEVRCAP